MSQNNCKHCEESGAINCYVCSYDGVRKEFIKVHGEQSKYFSPPCPFNDENGRIYCFRYEAKPDEIYRVIVLTELEGAEPQTLYWSKDAKDAERFIKDKIKIRRVPV